MLSIFFYVLFIVTLTKSQESSYLIEDEYNNSLLYPTESESREVRKLDGIWNFLKCVNLTGLYEKWYKDDLNKFGDVIQIAVPASFNDLTTDLELRDHVGLVWYERKFFVPRQWSEDRRIWLRFGSVHYATIVWLNSKNVLSHAIGHLPFEAEITNDVKYGAENRLTVLVDNTLNNYTIPQGKIIQENSDNGPVLLQTYTFDFFNYAGIHRSVHLHTTPKVYIRNVTIYTDLESENKGLVYYNVSIGGISTNDIKEQKLFLHVQLRAKTGEIVAHDIVKTKFNGLLTVSDVILWWPYLMNANPGYLYTIEIYLHAYDDLLLDVYRFKIGIRKLSWNNNTLMINNKPIYLRGFGRHEDSDIRGKGLDNALLIRDFSLIKWIGANAYRTSHYPYSEESMQFADEHGIMIIDECSSVNTDIFDKVLLENHKSALQQLILRDRNHPSVIMWSIANEPRSHKEAAENYFKTLAAWVKSLDKTRPITASINEGHNTDKLAQYLDIISFNRYNAWYQNTGHLNMIVGNLLNEATAWRNKFNKPIIMSEYGADTVTGIHFLPAAIFSEDYQIALFEKHFEAFDVLRSYGWFIGEFVWNFADFETEQSITRVGGNKKGIFTRNRQPKSVAYLLRQRYHNLAYEDGAPIVNSKLSHVIEGRWRKLNEKYYYEKNEL